MPPEIDTRHLNELQAVLALLNDNKKNEAREILERVLHENPDDHNALQLFGALLIDGSDRDKGVAYLERSNALKPGKPATLNNLGCAYFELTRYADAAAQFEKVVALWPDRAASHFNLANSLFFVGRLQEALSAYDKTLQLQPDHHGALCMRVSTATYMCEWNSEAALLSLARAPDFTGQPFQLLQLTDDPAVQLNAARGHAATQALPAAAIFPTRAYEFRTKIRVAYVSGGFQNHPIGQAAVELFECHDRTAFETFGISLTADDGGALRKRLAGAFTHFIDASRLPDDEIARQLRAAGIDIAVDLDGYTHGKRTGIFSRRPAPIQVNYLGYPGTLGADCYDYILVDPFVASPEQQPHYSENLVHLPTIHLPSDRKRAITEPTPPRSAYGLPETGFVFCAFNSAQKIRPDVFAVWMRLLKSVPGSVLWLRTANTWAMDNLNRAIAMHGIAPDRVIFSPRMPSSADYLAQYRAADVFLDTFPYSGFTTVNDAVWAGLPVVALAGRAFVARGAGSVLTALEMPELITYSIDDYERLALDLSRNPAKLRAVREKLIDKRKHSALFDTDALARQIETAFKTMMDVWKSGEKPRPFAVPK